MLKKCHEKTNIKYSRRVNDAKKKSCFDIKFQKYFRPNCVLTLLAFANFLNPNMCVLSAIVIREDT